MIDLMRAEFLKLRSTRTALGLFIGAVVVSVGPAILIMSLFPHDVLAEQGGVSVAAATGLTIVPMLAVVFGILGMTNEYRHGTITYTYLAAPRRGLVIMIKLFCYALVGAAVMAVTALLVVAAIAAVAAIRGVHVPWLAMSTVDDFKTLRDIALFLLTVGLMTAFGVGLGALFRSQVPTVTGVLIWALAIEGIVTAIKPRIGRFLPFTAFQQLNFGGARGSEAVATLTRQQAFLVSIAYITAVSVAAVFISMRRDVT
jgi:ABC-2 type transport system permease protein